MLQLTDAQWLVSDQSAQLLQDTQARFGAGNEILQVVKSLRKNLSPERASLIAELAQLRIRGRRKFDSADQMFFTREALEMATDQKIAVYKAKRFQNFENVVDCCCSIGGDLCFLASRKTGCKTLGIDLDPAAVLLANKNLQVHNHSSSAVVSNFFDLQSSDFDAIHVDPDRRQHGRSTFGDKFEPPLDAVFEKLSGFGSAAIKVAAATAHKEFYPNDIERQWIGHSRECKQQIIWTGDLATRKNCHVASVIVNDKVTEFAAPLDKVDHCRVGPANQIGEFVFEPHNTVLAAGLIDALADEFDLKRIDTEIAYLTGDQSINNDLLQQFRVLECVSGDSKKISAAIDRHELGKLEIKNRGVEEDFVNQIRQTKCGTGDRAGTIILTRFQGNHCAILGDRTKMAPSK